MHDIVPRAATPFVFAAAAAIAAAPAIGKGTPNQVSACALNSAKGDIKHVVFLIFDNVHSLRDDPNVPSDLEQMPNLLNFIRGNGTLLTNERSAARWAG